MEFKAKTVYECWQIARDEAEQAQEKLNEANRKFSTKHLIFSESALVYRDRNQAEIERNIADKIALRILHGELHDKS